MIRKLRSGVRCATVLVSLLGCDGAIVDGDTSAESSSLVNFGDCVTERCTGGRDEDCDGKIDCEDTECSEDPRCACTDTESFENCASPGDEDCDGAADCADSDCAELPSCSTRCVAAEFEVCSNGVDDDCNGLVDCEDPECAERHSCASGCQASSEFEVTCSGGIDEDCDGQIDCSDSDCAGNASCPSACTSRIEICSNGSDDDCDGQIDCDDDGCASEPVCGGCVPTATREFCSNGVDDDCNGQLDCEDNGCTADAACRTCVPTAAREFCRSPADEDCDGHVDCDDSDCAADPVCNGCVPTRARELCANGVDDDCDGQLDCLDSDCADAPACTVRCEPTEGNNCNGDMGYGDACAPQDNTNGCTPLRFDAWCNRRNPEREGVWYLYLSTWVDDRCDGVVLLEDEQYADYYCRDSSGITYRCQTPLVFVFDGAPVSYAKWTGSAVFDLGKGYANDWPTARTPWLALDRDGDGRITSGRELFGSAIARNGFEALRFLDSNGDGRITAADRDFARLLLWYDDGDRISGAAELVALPAAGIESIELAYVDSPRCTDRGNCERERAGFTWRDAEGALRHGEVVDVHLRNQQPLLACVAPE